MKHKNDGFTMVELLVVVAIIGVLAGIGFPAYQDSVKKSRRSDAKAALSALQMAEEKFRVTCPYYAAKLDSNKDNYKCDTSSAGSTLTFDATSNDGYYNVGVFSATTTTYTLKAWVASTGKQKDDTNCQSFFLYQDGTKASSTEATPSTTPTTDANGCW